MDYYGEADLLEDAGDGGVGGGFNIEDGGALDVGFCFHEFGDNMMAEDFRGQGFR